MKQAGGVFWSGIEWDGRHAWHRDLVALAGPSGRPPSQPAPRQESEVRILPRSAFAGGLAVEPRVGRFYPPRMLEASVRATLPNGPFRVIEVGASALRIDANDALAGHVLTPVAETWPGLAAGPALPPDTDPVAHLVAAGCGFQSAAAACDPEIWKLSDFARADPGPDRGFYRTPRLVHHIDATARAVLAECHRRQLRASGIADDAPVLDLMSSWTTHLPDESTFDITGLGLNEAELAANGKLAWRIVADLNARPALPFADAHFAAVLCALSVEYLTDPVRVFREVARVLAPGGVLIVSWSERWFPPKAIAIWSELHPYERVAFVVDGLRQSAAFADLRSESRRGLVRPAADRYADRLPGSDPIYTVTARRP